MKKFLALLLVLFCVSALVVTPVAFTGCGGPDNVNPVDPDPGDEGDDTGEPDEMEEEEGPGDEPEE